MKQFDFYTSKIKPDMQANCTPSLYDKVINKSKVSHCLYGIASRSNKAGQVETTRDSEAILSIFDENCFKFYLVKYCELLGLQSLISLIENDTSALKISYYQKIRIIDYIISYEKELQVEESSWKHCLLFLFLNGVLS